MISDGGKALLKKKKDCGHFQSPGTQLQLQGEARYPKKTKQEIFITQSLSRRLPSFCFFFFYFYRGCGPVWVWVWVFVRRGDLRRLSSLRRIWKRQTNPTPPAARSPALPPRLDVAAAHLSSPLLVTRSRYNSSTYSKDKREEIKE